MARRKRKSDSGSFFGLVLLEAIALVVFFFLFKNAQAHRASESNRAPESIVNVSNDSRTNETASIETYQMFERSPLEDLLAQKPTFNRRTLGR